MSVRLVKIGDKRIRTIKVDKGFEIINKDQDEVFFCDGPGYIDVEETFCWDPAYTTIKENPAWRRSRFLPESLRGTFELKPETPKPDVTALDTVKASWLTRFWWWLTGSKIPKVRVVKSDL